MLLVSSLGCETFEPSLLAMMLVNLEAYLIDTVYQNYNAILTEGSKKWQ